MLKGVLVSSLVVALCHARALNGGLRPSSELSLPLITIAEETDSNDEDPRRMATLAEPTSRSTSPPAKAFTAAEMRLWRSKQECVEGIVTDALHNLQSPV